MTWANKSNGDYKGAVWFGGGSVEEIRQRTAASWVNTFYVLEKTLLWRVKNIDCVGVGARVCLFLLSHIVPVLCHRQGSLTNARTKPWSCCCWSMDAVTVRNNYFFENSFYSLFYFILHSSSCSFQQRQSRFANIKTNKAVQSSKNYYKVLNILY